MSNKIKLLYDLVATQPNSSGKRHGGGRYGEIIFFRMIERKIDFASFYDSRKWINPSILKACLDNHISLYDLKELCVEDILSISSCNRVYSCMPDSLSDLKNCNVFGTVHGLRELETSFNSIFFKYNIPIIEKIKLTIKKIFHNRFRNLIHKRYLNRYFNNNFHIITVSQHSRYSFLTFFPEKQDVDIKVFYSPNTSSKHKAVKFKESTKYMLMVSGNRWEKNNLRAIEAFDRLVSTGQLRDFKAIVTGATRKDFKYKFQNPEAFEFRGYVEDEELENLYANAYLLVYPSLNEGFGYPPLEAMRYSVPVITSSHTSIGEVCGDAVLYFDPFSVHEIMNRMLMMVDGNIHSEYAKKGYERYEKIKARQEQDLDNLIDYICFSE